MKDLAFDRTLIIPALPMGTEPSSHPRPYFELFDQDDRQCVRFMWNEQDEDWDFGHVTAFVVDEVGFPTHAGTRTFWWKLDQPTAAMKDFLTDPTTEHLADEAHVDDAAKALQQRITAYHAPAIDFTEVPLRRAIWRAARRIAELEIREIRSILARWREPTA